MVINGLKNDIIYPIFIECVEFAPDSFWRGIFEDLAYGKTPYGLYISKDFLCCSYKNKEFSYKIEDKDPKVMYQDIHYLLLNKAGILSNGDKNKKRLDFIRAEEEIRESRKTWGDIKKKSVKDFLIEMYVVNMKNKHNLSVHTSRKLLSLIMIAFVFKTLTNKDVTYIDGEVVKIEGIEFKDNNFIFTRDIYGITSIELTPEIILERKLISDGWYKYCSSLTPKALKHRIN